MATKKTVKKPKRSARRAPLPANVIPASRLKQARKAAPARPPASGPGQVINLDLARWARGMSPTDSSGQLEVLDLVLHTALNLLAKVRGDGGPKPGAA